jgi:(p)ppGpp synthase/HD superfamily hydrolase
MLDYSSTMRLSDAFYISANAHEGQFRNDKVTPYLEHPVRVAVALRDRWGIEDYVVLATAYCHDVLEDSTKYTYDDLVKRLGVDVAFAVLQLTNKPPDGVKWTFDEKSKNMLEHAKTFTDAAKIVKLADRYDNLQDAVQEWEPWRVKRYAKVGMELIEAMQPMPDCIKEFEKEARRFFGCLI